MTIKRTKADNNNETKTVTTTMTRKTMIITTTTKKTTTVKTLLHLKSVITDRELRMTFEMFRFHIPCLSLNYKKS